VKKSLLLAPKFGSFFFYLSSRASLQSLFPSQTDVLFMQIPSPHLTSPTLQSSGLTLQNKKRSF